MSNYELHSYGSPDCSDLYKYSPEEDFFISIEFDLKNKDSEGLLTFYFFLCTRKGFENQKFSDELEFVVFVDKFSIEFVKNYLEEKVVNQVAEFDDERLIKYLASNFNLESY